MGSTTIPNADPWSDMSLPILIGFSGKHLYSTDVDENRRRSEIFDIRWLESVEWLDARYPATPKVLMCGGDAGADLAAVTAVLATDETGKARHPLWAVVLVDAFEGYEPRDEATAAAYGELLRDHPTRIRRMTLRPLKAETFDDAEVDAAIGRDSMAFGADGSDTRRRFRSDHFEQQGLWLARSATIFFAVCTGEETGTSADGRKPSVVGRTVAFRRTGLPDAAAAEVIARSAELFTASILEEPDARWVLWIDPSRPTDEKRDPPFEIRTPLTVFFRQDGTCRTDLSKGGPERAPTAAPARPPIDRQIEILYASPFAKEPPDRRVSEESTLRATFGTADFFETLNDGIARDPARPRVFAPFPTDTESTLAPEVALRAVRSGSRVQQSPLGAMEKSLARRVKWSLRAMIVASVVAVACYEVFAEILRTRTGWLAAYVALVLLVAAAAVFVNRARWAQRAEDLRGIKEVLRVQIAWWSAGIDRVVDRLHLRGIDSDLTEISKASATITLWASLRSGYPEVDRDMRIFSEAVAEDATSGERTARIVIAAEALCTRLADVSRDWIVEQTNYHHRNWIDQRGFVHLAEQASHLSLAVALAALGVLFLFLHAPHDFVAALTEALDRPEPWMTSIVGAWWLVVLAAANSVHAHFTSDPTMFDEHRSSFAERGIAAVALVAGVGTFTGPILLSRFSEASTIAWPIAASVTVIATAVLCIVRIGWNAKTWVVPHLHRRQVVAAAILALVATTGSVIAFARLLVELWAWLGDAPHHASEENLEAAIHRLTMAGSVVLLGVAAMLRYYVEHRNHKAQFAEYGNCNRAFLRASDFVERRLGDLKRDLQELRRSAPDPGSSADVVATSLAVERMSAAVRELRRLYVELGILALDENESWLQAHRERPMEPISGG